jgi:hypothetical protein
VLVPLAAVLQAQHAAQARPLGLNHPADPKAVVPIPLRGVLEAMVPAVGARVDRPLTAHLPSGSSRERGKHLHARVTPARGPGARNPRSAIAGFPWSRP